MSRLVDIFLTMLAPIIWGSTYIVTSEWLPADYPLTIAMLRALPAGLVILVVLRQYPGKDQWLKMFILGSLNFTIFWACLFVSAYRLPGGVAATLMAMQPLIVIGLGYGLFSHRVTRITILAAAAGLFGVALLVLQSTMILDAIGIIAALVGTMAMALGTLLSKQWRGDSSLLAFTGWQLTTGGLLLLPLALYFEPSLPTLDLKSIGGLLWLGLIGALVSYILWFNGINRLSSAQVSTLIFLSPITAIILGWLALGQSLNVLQIIGVLIIFMSIIATQTTGAKNDEHPASD